jgi:hypothetical protein
MSLLALRLFFVTVHCPYKQCIIISDASFYKMLFSHISHSEFLVLTHNILGMIVSEKNSESKVMFLIYSSSDLPILSFLRKSCEIMQCFWNV